MTTKRTQDGTLSPGHRLGRYEIMRHLSTGGMAEIYVARSVGPKGLGQPVVIKRLLPELAMKPQFVSMFLEEGCLQARMDHDGIPEMYDMGCESGSYFHVLEYIEGRDLLRILRSLKSAGSHLPLEFVLKVGMGVAKALQHVHACTDASGNPLKVIHRDITLSNIMVGFDGSVRLIDFGVAKNELRRNNSTPGLLKGKFGYMSPEALRCQEIDQRSDIFSLGVVLFELVTCTRLFYASDELGTMRKVLEGRVPAPKTIRRHCPKALERTILKALSADRELRHANAEELFHELEACALSLASRASCRPLGDFVRSLFAEYELDYAELECSAETAEAADITWTETIDVERARNMRPKRAAILDTLLG